MSPTVMATRRLHSPDPGQLQEQTAVLRHGHRMVQTPRPPHCTAMPTTELVVPATVRLGACPLWPGTRRVPPRAYASTGRLQTMQVTDHVRYRPTLSKR